MRPCRTTWLAESAHLLDDGQVLVRWVRSRGCPVRTETTMDPAGYGALRASPARDRQALPGYDALRLLEESAPRPTA